MTAQARERLFNILKQHFDRITPEILRQVPDAQFSFTLIQREFTLFSTVGSFIVNFGQEDERSLEIDFSIQSSAPPFRVVGDVFMHEHRVLYELLDLLVAFDGEAFFEELARRFGKECEALSGSIALAFKNAQNQHHRKSSNG